MMLALCFALLATIGELASLATQRSVLRRELFLSDDSVWMIPVANVALFSLAWLVVAVIQRMVRRADRAIGTVRRADRAIAIACFGFLAAFAVLLSLPWLTSGAAAVFSGALLVWSVRGARPARIAAAVRRAAPALVAVLILLVGGTLLARAARSPGLADARPPAGAPNVLLIVLDTVRASSMSLYGYSLKTTPGLDARRSDGVVFAHAWAPAPWTLPSHATMFTGRLPAEHEADWMTPLDGRYPVLAERFLQAGYATGGFTANAIYCGREQGLSRGFVHYVDYERSLGEMFYSAALGRMAFNSATLRRWTKWYDVPGRVTAAEVNEQFLDWQSRLEGRPFFAFLNYFDAHAPVLPPAPFDTMFASSPRDYLSQLRYWNHQAGFLRQADLTAAEENRERAAYDGAIAYMDRELGRLLDELQQRGLLNETIVIVTSDHGEMFGENGLHSHGTSLHRLVLEVPLFVLAPGRTPAGVVVTEPATLRDLPATVLDLAGIPPGPIPGSSLRAAWSEPGWRSPTPIVSSVTWDGSSPRRQKLEAGMWSLVSDGLHYIRNADGSEELYELSDAEEDTNIAGRDAARVMSLRTRLAGVSGKDLGR
jgi:arylsulfatase A-like enzyme